MVKFIFLMKILFVHFLKAEIRLQARAAVPLSCLEFVREARLSNEKNFFMAVFHMHLKEHKAFNVIPVGTTKAGNTLNLL